VAGALSAGQAQALLVNVGGKLWDVTIFNGTYQDNAGKFALPANGGKMPWWQDPAGLTSALFAQAVGNALGYPNLTYPGSSSGGNGGGSPGPVGPFFTYSTPGISGSGQNLVRSINAAYAYGSPASVSVGNPTGFTSNDTLWFAQAELAVPGPLPALGAAAAFGFSRKLRNRIKASKAVGASFTAA